VRYVWTFRSKWLQLLLACGLLHALQPVAQASSRPSKSSTRAWAVRWQPIRLVNGAPAVFQVTPSVRLQSLSGRWLERDVFFVFDAATQTWLGIAGVGLETPAGTYPLRLKGATASGKEVSFDREIRVRTARYPVIAVSVSKKFTSPSPEELERISQEKVLKQELFSRVDPAREWSGRFFAPVKARISDVFGTRRTFNGKVSSVHQGLDYAVPQGTPVSALNRGTVLLARPLFFEGNCVVLDHGQGLLSLYMHLSSFKVKEGETVRRGQEIGVSGGTGRATGPHLHVAVRWQGVYVNPATLFKLKLP
jgi:murein DD-endopeptidase MepM/ murein hydrolase activator NlpD